MKTATEQSLPETRQDSPAASAGPPGPVLKKRWVRCAICFGTAVIGIPFMTVVLMALWVLVKYFVIER